MAMVEELPLLELEFRIGQLPPISRGAPISDFSRPLRALAGPWLHADRLIDLWRVADGESVPLAQAWRLLELEAVVGAIQRTWAASAEGYTGDPRYWAFPPFKDLLPELQAAAWQALLAGELEVKALKGVRARWAKRPQVVLAVELPRLSPCWELSRLTCDGQDAYVEVRVRRVVAGMPKPAWGKHLSTADLAAAVENIEQSYPPDAHPPFPEFWNRLKGYFPGISRADARAALKDHAPRLIGRRGYRSSKSPN
jgi:hypothetical protein